MGALKDYLPGFINEFLRERRRDRVVGKAIDLEQRGEYAEAATIYDSFATESLEETELLAAMYHGYSFDMCLKAGDRENALSQARNALRLLCTQEGKWLTYNAGENADDLISMASRLYAAGFLAEGDALSAEANEQFEKHGLPIRCSAGPVGRNEFPAICVQCGGSLPYSPYVAALKCPFCETVVYAE